MDESFVSKTLSALFIPPLWLITLAIVLVFPNLKGSVQSYMIANSSWIFYLGLAFLVGGFVLYVIGIFSFVKNILLIVVFFAMLASGFVTGGLSLLCFGIPLLIGLITNPGKALDPFTVGVLPRLVGQSGIFIVVFYLLMISHLI